MFKRVFSISAPMAQMASNDQFFGYPFDQSQLADWSSLYVAGQNQLNINPGLNASITNCQVEDNEYACQVPRVLRKRGREEQNRNTINGALSNGSWCSCFGENVGVMLQKEIQETNLFLLLQTEKLRADVAQKGREHWTNLIHTMDEGLQRAIRCKDEEIARLSSRNSALEEKLKTLSMQWQTWKALVHTHETTVASLRRDREAAQANVGKGDGGHDIAGDIEDASSCCDVDGRVGARLRCVKCLRNDISMLVLPCRHLCLCTECDPMTRECPICMSVKATSIHVFMS